MKPIVYKNLCNDLQRRLDSGIAEDEFVNALERLLRLRGDQEASVHDVAMRNSDLFLLRLGRLPPFQHFIAAMDLEPDRPRSFRSLLIEQARFYCKMDARGVGV